MFIINIKKEIIMTDKEKDLEILKLINDNEFSIEDLFLTCLRFKIDNVEMFKDFSFNLNGFSVDINTILGRLIYERYVEFDYEGILRTSYKGQAYIKDVMYKKNNIDKKESTETSIYDVIQHIGRFTYEVRTVIIEALKNIEKHKRLNNIKWYDDHLEVHMVAKNAIKFVYKDFEAIVERDIKDITRIYYSNEDSSYKFIMANNFYDLCYEYVRLVEYPNSHGSICPVCGNHSIISDRSWMKCCNAHIWKHEGFSNFFYSTKIIM